MGQTDLDNALIEHRRYVGPPERYDLASASQFNLLTALGLREQHYVLDVGCGSLRGGRLLIPYLLPGRYFGLEPNQWLVDQGIAAEVGKDLIAIKRPTFGNDGDFTLSSFGRSFDYILAQSIFSHASGRQIVRCLQEAQKVLEPTGVFVATFFIGDSDYAGDQWVYPGSVHYRWETFQRMAEEAQLRCKKLSWTHPNAQTWVAITHPQQLDQVPDLADTGRSSVLEHTLAATQQKLQTTQSLRGLKLLKKLNRLFGRRV